MIDPVLCVDPSQIHRPSRTEKASNCHASNIPNGLIAEHDDDHEPLYGRRPADVFWKKICFLSRGAMAVTAHSLSLIPDSHQPALLWELVIWVKASTRSSHIRWISLTVSWIEARSCTISFLATLATSPDVSIQYTTRWKSSWMSESDRKDDFIAFLSSNSSHLSCVYSRMSLRAA